MKADFSINFLMGFLGFFIYLAIVLTFGFKSENISIYDRKKFNRNRIIQLLIWFAPFLLAFLYLTLTNRAGLGEFMMFVFLPPLILFGYEFFLFQPKLDALVNDGNKLFRTLRNEGQEARYSFNSNFNKLVLNRDRPDYIRGYLVDVHIDRVCKNDFGEYFWIEASAKGASEPSIKQIDTHSAKNLLRVNRKAYLQEFNEEPYYKIK